MSDTYYCDNYEELTGRDRDGTLGPIQTKVIAAPETPEVVTSDVPVETKDQTPA